MSGGIRQVRLDGAGDFRSLRKATFGFEQAPLPQSLPLPTAESELNQAPSLQRWTPRTREWRVRSLMAPRVHPSRSNASS